MIQYGVLEMDVIYNLLGPSDKEIIKDSDKEFNEAKDFVRKMTIVSTSQDQSKKDDDGNDGLQDDHESLVASNQKFGLLKALLEVGAWTHAEQVISRLPIYYAVAKPAIAKALANLIHVKMAPVHKNFSGRIFDRPKKKGFFRSRKSCNVSHILFNRRIWVFQNWIGVRCHFWTSWFTYFIKK